MKSLITMEQTGWSSGPSGNLHERIILQLVGMPTSASNTIIQSPEAVFFIAIESFVARFSRDTELPAHDRHLLVIKQADYKAETFIHTVTIFQCI